MCVYVCLCGRGLVKVRCDTVWAKAQICHGCHCCLAMRRIEGERVKKEVSRKKARNSGKRAEDSRGEKTMKVKISKEQKWRSGKESWLHMFPLHFMLTNPHWCVFMHVPCTSVCFSVSWPWKVFWFYQVTQKVALSSNLWLPQPNRDLSPHVHWPGSYVHSRQPFPDSIKEAAELNDTEGENGGAESLTTSTMTTTVSQSSPAFWRGQTLKIWEPHSQQHTEPSQLREKNRSLTGLQAEAKKVYKQLAALTNNKGRNCQGHSLVFQQVKNGAKLDKALLWKVCMIILVYPMSKSKQIRKTEHAGCMSRSWSSAPISRMFLRPLPSTSRASAISLHSSTAQHPASGPMR